ncbi:MAG: hypothetical protein M3Q71_22405 [Chloroflexota bacterium]|nr:hypothetical protein [Chloroflexota bacterium]
MESGAERPARDEQLPSSAPTDSSDPNAIAQPLGRAARDPDEGPGLGGGSAAAAGEEVTDEEIGGGD